MAQERGSEHIEQEERSLVVRTEQVGIENIASVPYLEKAGFSPMLPQRLMRLNEVLTRVSPQIESVGIELIPGRTPLINTSIEHKGGLRAFLKAIPKDKRARFSIDNYDTDLGVNVTLEDIKIFMLTNFPDTKATFYAEGNPNTQEKYDNFHEDLKDVDEETLDYLLETVPAIGTYQDAKTLPYFDFQIRISEQEEPLFSFILQAGIKPDTRRRVVACRLFQVHFEGHPLKVENIIDAVSNLLDKDPNYPFLRRNT